MNDLATAETQGIPGRLNPTPDRVVIINDQCVARGGAAVLAVASAIGLRDRGVPVTFLSADHPSNAELSAHRVELVGMGQRPLLEVPGRVAMSRGLYNPATVATIRRWIAENDTPDTVYHLHQWAHILSPSVFHALRPVFGQLVLSTHDYFLICPNGAFTDYRDNSVCGRLPLRSACLATNCDRRHYSHKLWRVARQVVRSALLNLARSDVPLVTLHPRMAPFFTRCGVPETVLRVLRNPARAFAEERITAERHRRFLFIGRLDTDKGPDLACRAARDAGVPLRVIGDGPIAASLRGEFPEVEFCGWCSHDEIRNRVRDARALVFTSRAGEPFGMVIVEALWSGLPVIVADGSTLLAEEVANAGVGVIYDARTGDGLAAAMRRLADDDAAVAAMSWRGFLDIPAIANTPAQWIDGLQAIYQERLRRAGAK